MSYRSAIGRVPVMVTVLSVPTLASLNLPDKTPSRPMLSPLLPPEETNAGTYTVWYKAQASGNYQDSAPVRVNVTIAPKQVTNPTIARGVLSGKQLPPGW